VTAYDKLDWHYDSAVEAGQPPENAFTHIGFYLAWLIRNDLHDPSLFPASHVAAVKSGEMTGSDLADDIDTKLVSAVMNAEGQAFSDARYRTYLAGYAAVFANEPEYGVSDEPASYARIAPSIDRLYAAWVADGRPPQPRDEAMAIVIPRVTAGTGFASAGRTTRAQLRAMADEIAARLGGRAKRAPAVQDEPFTAAELEAMLPRNLTDPPLEVESHPASQWGSSLLNRALKRLDVRPGDAVVVTAMGGHGPDALALTLYGLPGVAADRLRTEFASVIHLPQRAAWTTRVMAHRTVNWATGDEFSVAFWARRGLVVHVAGTAEAVEDAVQFLP
jgi:hypothetical protein